MPGHLALILHAHLPFVRHPEHDEFLEEDWLFEAMTESYIPLLRMMQGLVRDGVPFRLTMSITPPLCAMLQDELLRARYLRYLTRTIDLAEREIDRTREQPHLQSLARFYFALLTETHCLFAQWNCDLLAQFRQLKEAGVLEIIASAATHGLLPLLAPPQAARAQVMIGCDIYREIFGADPAGFWLPECAYTPGLDAILQEANLRWFVLDSHGLTLAKPRPRTAVYAPCFTPAGPAAFARDPSSSRQVWSAQEGYPGDPAYREFYRDIGYDLPPELVFRGSSTKTPRFTGLKYHRITGSQSAKEPYHREWAEKAADAQASHFLDSRCQQVRELQSVAAEPIVVMPFDAELFGHWWYEGPLFVDRFIRKAAARQSDVQLTTPGEYLAAHPTQEVVTPAASSWGEKGYWGVWLHESNAWVYPHLHSAARRMVEVAQIHRHSATESIARVLQQLARELLLAQSSDWGFLIKTQTARHYAAKRVNEHISRFNRLYDLLNSGKIDEAFLSECETRDNLFPNLAWNHYL